METRILTWNDIDEAAKILKEGGIVCFPTETVYGIACLAASERAYERLIGLKRRPPEKPFTVMCANFTDILRYGIADKKAMHVLHKFMPGPLTALLPARKETPYPMTCGHPTIGARIPGLAGLRALLEKSGPLLVPSANVSGEPPAVNFVEVKEAFFGKVDAIIEGECSGKTPSTIVDLSGEPTIVREGPIAAHELKAAYRENNDIVIALGSDHGGYQYKDKIAEHVRELGYQTLDFGTDGPASCDYPLFAEKAARAVAKGEADLGILVCTSGEGIAIAANKIKGVRCGIGYDDVATGKTREHNNANMIAFGQAYMREEDVLRRVDIFLGEVFSPEAKHHRRVDEIKGLE